MADPWLSIVGISEDGLAGLSESSRAALDAAEVVFGGPRHLDLAGVGPRGAPWPVPFSTAPVLDRRGRPTAVLASGDPFWHGAGGSLAAALDPLEWRAFPAASTFTLACARLGWRIEETVCLGLHAAPFERLRPHLAAGTRLVCLLRDGAAPAELARWLTDAGFGASTLHVLEALGGPAARHRTARADAAPPVDIAAPVAAAIAVAGGPALSAVPGRDETLFAHDGQITKAPVRAVTLAALAPHPGAHLWDLGAGSGAVAVEWCLAAAGATATAVERRPDRAALVRENAARFGLSDRIEVIEGDALAATGTLPPPDAVFLGGGADKTLAPLWDRLSPGTRLVAAAVTLETEAQLITAHGRHGGRLSRVEIAEAAPLGGFRGWHRARPVTHWMVTR